jgi:hypothetical protein
MKKVFLTSFIFLFLFVSGSASGAEKKGAKPKVEPQDSTRLLIPLPFFSKVGFQSGFIFTKDFDTGVDFGTILGKDFYQDFLEVSTILHLWGATNDSTDVASAGLDASFTYKIPIEGGMTSFAGFILGCYIIHQEKTIPNNGTPRTITENRLDYQTFLTAGAEYYIQENRTLFLQFKYGVTRLSRERHILFGINFYTEHKQFKTWTVPPLMR